MLKKVVFLPTILVTLFCMTALIVPAHSHKTKSKIKRAAFDNLVYAQVFNMVDAFDKEADKSTDEDRKIYFDNYFAREAELSEEQQAILKTAARNFMSAFQAASYRDRLTLSVAYRNELRKLFGDDFNRFDAFVRSEIAPNFKIFKADDGEVVSGASGTSSISVNTSMHRLEGSSSTIFMFFARNPQLTCAVSGNMNGPNVSESQVLSNNCNQNLTVNMYSTAYLPNSQYCVNGTHVFAGSSLPPSNSCLTTQAASSKVIHTTFEQLQTDDLPIDVNPNTGGGLRIFPDKKLPTEMTERRKILVRAKIGSNAAGIKVYFRNFDFDDPSANAAPVDSNGSAGNDNNGNVDGTTNTRAGQFSASLSQYDCQISSGGAECFTDSNGETTVYYTLTMQPGDNFSVVAGTDSVYLGGLTLAADGVNLKDASNVQTPVSRTSDITECYRSAVNACRTDMLTVWRRLHIEVDSMGAVSGNKVEGTFPAIGKVGTGLQTLPVNVSPALEPNRFEKGRIVIGTRQFGIINSNLSANPPVNANTADTVTIDNNLTIFGISAGQTFTLYDDDDFNDSGIKNGDNGEPVQQFANSLKHLLSEDGNHSEDNTPKNILGSAYIRPTYTWASTYNNNVPFDLNVEDSETQSNGSTNLVDANRGSKNSEGDNFWVAYIIFSYQPGLANDIDNNLTETATLGLAPAVACDCYSSPCPRSIVPQNSCGNTPPLGGIGSFIYLEVSQDYRKLWLNPPSPYTPKTFNELETTVPHELGHQLGLLGDRLDTLFKVMDYQDPVLTSGDVEVAFHPEHINILRRRIKSPGQL